MVRKSVLIIKHGYSDSCDCSLEPVVDYAEVLRCTCLLEDFRGWHVTWITAPGGLELLWGNYLIDELYFAEIPEELPGGRMQGHYDVVINLEKQEDWCKFALRMSADERYGFKNSSETGLDCLFEASAQTLRQSTAGEEGDSELYRPYQEKLFGMIGREWKGQRYVLSYAPRVIQIYDIGLNHRGNSDRPARQWPQEYWQELYRQLSKKYAVSWQPKVNKIRSYADWLASCGLIITGDDWGLHLGLALQRKVVAMFGPTAPEKVYMYGHGIKLTPMSERLCQACRDDNCHWGGSCMENIPVDMVVEAVDMLGEMGGSEASFAPEPGEVKTQLAGSVA